MNRSTIHLENLSIGYHQKNTQKVVAQHISADIYSKELTCLLGSNGAGKSTLLRTLSGFLPKLDGRVYIQGKEIAQYKDKELARIISVVLTERCDVFQMSVREMVSLGRTPYTGFWGQLNDEDKKIVQQSLEWVGIEHLSECLMEAISDGERQKVMIAKALAQETPIIFLDEPTAFLDYPSKVEMMQLLHKLSREMNKTIFLSTHDLELALQLADRLWLMKPHNNLITGTPEDLSLNGSLQNFFERKEICFDNQSGLYRVQPTYKHKVLVQGEGTPYAMLCKALKRNEIESTSDETCSTCIQVTSKGFVCRTLNGSVEASNISEIISFIDSVFQS